MIRHSVLVCLFLCLPLSSCMPRSIASLKESYPEPYQFTVDKPYQEEYKTVIDYLDRCYLSSILLPLENNHILYPDLKMGEITQVSPIGNIYAPAYMVHIVVAESVESNEKTNVSVYGSNGWGRLIESGRCPGD